MKCRRWTLAASPLFANLALTIVPALTTAIPAAHTQTYTVIYNFTNGLGGPCPSQLCDLLIRRRKLIRVSASRQPKQFNHRH